MGRENLCEYREERCLEGDNITDCPLNSLENNKHFQVVRQCPVCIRKRGTRIRNRLLTVVNDIFLLGYFNTCNHLCIIMIY